MAEIFKISSRTNQHILRARRARDGREPDDIFFEGVRLSEEALRSNVTGIFAIAADSFGSIDRHRQLLKKILDNGTDILQVPDKLFNSLADTANSQGIVLVAERPRTGLHGLLRSGKNGGVRQFIYLDRIGDPSNLGAVLRTAEAAGTDGVIISKGSADPFSPRALRAAMGSSLRVPIWEKAGPAECFEWAKKKSLCVIAADVSGTKSYAELDWARPSLAVFGSEGHGLDKEVLKQADEIVTIPMLNGVESLNLAVAVGIVLFEGLRQRGSSGRVTD